MDRCPEQKTMGDVDVCTLKETICVLMGYDTCDYYEEIKKEWLMEDMANEPQEIGKGGIDNAKI